MRARVVCLRLWLVAMSLSTLNALRIVLTDWPGFARSFPGAEVPIGRGLATTLPLLLLVSLAGLWRWRRWALQLLVIATVATLAFDAIARGPWLHMVAAVVSLAISAALLWWNRDGFALRKEEAR